SQTRSAVVRGLWLHGSTVRTRFWLGSWRISVARLHRETKMFGKHIIRHLSAYQDSELSAAENLRIEAHLEQCEKCRVAYEEIRFGARLASALSISNAPDLAGSGLYRIPDARRRRWVPRAAVAGVLAVAVLFIVLLTETRRANLPSWEVTGLPGTSRL